nr:gamma subclass chorismate mutase AroQ [uncultured Rhodopila sp.]
MPASALLVARRALLGSIVASALRRGAEADDTLAVLIALVGERLRLMQAVAESKWNSGAPVEDEAREARLIAGVVALAPSYGLDPRQAAAFFRAQIEAAKCVESALIARWAAARAAPFAAPADLQTAIRPQLDRLTPALLAALAAAMPQVRQGGAEQIAAASRLDDPMMAVAVARALQPLLELAGARAVAPTTPHP